MQEVRTFFSAKPGQRAQIAVLMSGTGSNAEALLLRAAEKDCAFEVKVLFTDAPESSRTEELSAKYNVPAISLDVRQFYADHGENDIKLNSDKRCKLREMWSEKAWQMLEPYKCDFAVFAGFVLLTNLAEKIICLNVHPGDLTVEDASGARRYAGLHFGPVERCILDDAGVLRSSVILVQAYSGNGKKDVDSGPVLGVSAPVPIDRKGVPLEELRNIHDARTQQPYRDRLREIAAENAENLKIRGDLVVLPQTVEAFAAGRYGENSRGKLCFLSEGGEWSEVKTVEYSENGKTVMIREKAMRPRRNKFIRYCRYLYFKIVREKGTPAYIARGWALGMFVGCVMPVFCQLIVSVPLSFVLRCSKVGAALGTFITTPPTAVIIYPIQIWVGNKIIGGDISVNAAGNLLKIFNDEALSFAEKWQAFANMGGELVAAFFAGGLLWAAIMTPLTYFGVRSVVMRYRRMRGKKQKMVKE